MCVAKAASFKGCAQFTRKDPLVIVFPETKLALLWAAPPAATFQLYHAPRDVRFAGAQMLRSRRWWRCAHSTRRVAFKDELDRLRAINKEARSLPSLLWNRQARSRGPTWRVAAYARGRWLPPNLAMPRRMACLGQAQTRAGFKPEDAWSGLDNKNDACNAMIAFVTG
jgi:hypothetical protein